jgi:7-cyano-7-deazaguanine reductase
MKKSKDLSLLGQFAELPADPAHAVIETFKNPGTKGGYSIILECNEFSSLCPVTGQPDYATITIEYRPQQFCIETKSLKYYLASYRNYSAFNEAIINEILKKLVSACKPKEMTVLGKFGSRGGISVTVQAKHPQSRV